MAAESSSEGKKQKLVPPPIVSKWKKERLQVLQTGEFTVLDVPEKAVSDKKKPQKKCAADAIAVKGKKFEWKPSPLLSSTIRVADLTGAALSSDGSLAVIAERMGGEGKANSTRIICIDIPNKRIADGFVIPEKLISSISFVPGSQSEVLGIRSGFEPFKVKPGLVRIDLKSRAVTDSFNTPGNREITSFSANEKSVFLTLAGSSSFFELDIDSFATVPVNVASRIPAPKVCVAGEKIILFGEKGVEIFRMDEKRWIPDEEILKAPARFTAAHCQVIDPAAPGLCFTGQSEENAGYLQGNTFKALKERVSGLTAWDPGTKLLFIELVSNSMISVLNMPEAVENVKPAAPNRLRPANRNGSFALLTAPGLKQQMIQIDNRGNVFLLDYSRLVRWKKSSVYIADRTAFR